MGNIKGKSMQTRLVEDEVIGWVYGNRVLREITKDQFSEVFELLNHKKTSVRWKAAHKLGKFGDPEETPHLVKALEDE